MPYDFGLFTIGAGSGGVRAARMSAGFGARVAVAESRFFGGTCVNVGCVPKKLMVYASHFGESFHDAEGFGWTVEGARFDWATFLARKDAEIARLNGIYRRLLVNAGATVLEGRARLVAPHTVEVTGADGTATRHTAERVLIATGGKAVRPEIPGAEHAYLSDDIFRLPAQPRRVIVVGGGYIGIEFAGIFRGLGSEVTLLCRNPRLLHHFDEEMTLFLGKEIEKKGISLKLGHEIVEITRQESGLRALLKSGEVREADAILYAIGRRPNTDALGLDELGVQRDARGAIWVDDELQTNIPGIYAIGDVLAHPNLTPVALAQGMALARSLYGKQPSRVDYEDIPTAVFSQPPFATVGRTEAQARAEFGEIDVFAAEFTPLLHTLSGNKERTLMKLLVERAGGRVVGVHMVGPDAPEIIQMAAVALRCRATKAQFDATIGIHPTAAEEFVTLRTARAANLR